MKMLLTVDIPHEPFNTFIREGTAGEVIGRILEQTKPEVCYFVEQHGRRGAVLVIDVEDASDVPSFSEPWFLKFNADCAFRIAMDADALGRAGLEALGKAWR